MDEGQYHLTPAARIVLRVIDNPPPKATLNRTSKKQRVQQKPTFQIDLNSKKSAQFNKEIFQHLR